MIWMRLSGSQEKKEKSDVSYKDIVKVNVTFNNISVIFMKETGVPGENH
jgi:hypothetical protein